MTWLYDCNASHIMDWFSCFFDQSFLLFNNNITWDNETNLTTTKTPYSNLITIIFEIKLFLLKDWVLNVYKSKEMLDFYQLSLYMFSLSV